MKAAIATLCLLAAPYLGWRFFEYHWYSGIIPANIGLGYPINISGVSGLREGCGAAIFRLDEATAKAISTAGLPFFEESKHSRNHTDSYPAFEKWHATPLKLDPALDRDGTILSPGLECSTADSELTSEIENALDSPGSYFAHGPEKIILVVPSKRIVVLSYNG